jgi:hypothetical protein
VLVCARGQINSGEHPESGVKLCEAKCALWLAGWTDGAGSDRGITVQMVTITHRLAKWRRFKSEDVVVPLRIVIS